MSSGLDSPALRLLLVEDSADDAELVLHQLREGGFAITDRRVESAEEMAAALAGGNWDAVITDYNLPGFGAMAALALLKQSGLDIPFIVVSGFIGEETAVAMMKAGAHDFVAKGNLARLVPAVERELGEAKNRARHRQSEEALRAKQKLLRDITAAMGEGILVMGPHGRLVFMNPEAERLLGWSEAELADRDIHDTIHYQKADGSPYPHDQCPVAGMVKEGRPYRSDDDVFIRKDGQDFPVSVVATPILEDGKVVASVTTFQDITQRKRAEKELEESRSQLRELSAFLQSVRENERMRIARELHDELGQVLTALKMDVAWLGSRLLPEQTPLVEKTDAMSRLIDSTVEAVYRIAEDLRPVLLDDLGLVPAIEWLAQEFQQRTGIVCELAVEGAERAVEAQVATAVFRIFQEALTNVKRHAEASRVVAVLRNSGDEIVLEVKDDGKGMSLEKDRRRKSYGLIGIRERTYMLGGTMNVVSSPDAGTAIEVCIPNKKKTTHEEMVQ